MYTVIDGKLFKNMLVGAYQLMSQKYDIINQLNVFRLYRKQHAEHSSFHVQHDWDHG